MNAKTGFIFSDLPFDIVVNHILPYTYETKPYENLVDIRTFISDFSMLDNYYSTEYNYHILLTDIVSFSNNGRLPTWGKGTHYYNFIKRHVMYKFVKDFELQTFVFLNIHNYNSNIVKRKIWFLWGLFTPLERTRFINKYIIDRIYVDED